MVHYVGHLREYWFCRSCWQEMPDLEVVRKNNDRRQNQIVNLSTGFSKRDRSVSTEVKN